MKWIQDYISYIEKVKNYSRHTASSYKSDLISFQDFLNSAYHIEIEEARKNHIRTYIVQLKQEGIQPKSINRKISSLSSFFKYLKRVGVVSQNPTATIQVLKSPTRLPSYVDESKVNNLIQLNEDDSFSAQRQNIIIALLYFTGMRRAELLSLKWGDINWEKETIKVIGKGNKERIIPMSQELRQRLDDYHNICSDTFSYLEHDYVVITDKGRPAYPKLVYNEVHKVLAAYNLSDKQSPHVLRHTFATHLANNGAELNAIKELLGHASLAATQVYTHNSIEKLKRVYKAAHPKSK